MCASKQQVCENQGSTGYKGDRRGYHHDHAAATGLALSGTDRVAEGAPGGSPQEVGRRVIGESVDSSNPPVVIAPESAVSPTPAGFGSGVRVLIGLAAFVVVVAGMRAASSLVVPFLLALFLAILSGPPLAWLRRRGMSRTASLIIVLSLLTIGSACLGALIAGTINRFVREWPTLYEPRTHELVTQWNTWVSEKIEKHAWLSSLRIEDVRKLWDSWADPGTLMQQFVYAMRTAGSLLSEAALILITAVFLVAEASVLPDKLRMMSPDAERRFADLSRIAVEVNRYMAIKTWISLMSGVIVAIGLKIIGVEFAMLWGLLTFFLNYVPNIGSILSAIPPLLLSLLQPGGGFGMFLAVLILNIAVNVVTGTFIEPRWMGRGLGISTLVVFVSLVFWGWVLGPVGMLISIPLTMAVKIALECSDDTRWFAILMGAGRAAPAASPKRA
jgi:AI-2 transport protein TqsA